MASLFSPDIEQHLLGLLLVHPDLYGELSLLNRDDFEPVRQRIFDVIKLSLDSSPQLSVTPIILVEKLKSYGQSVTEEGGMSVLDYLDGLVNLGRLVERKDAGSLLKELKLLTIKRELVQKLKDATAEVIKSTTFDGVVKAVDVGLTSVTTRYFKGRDTQDMFAGMEASIEASGAQEKEDLGYVGVIPSIDRTLGALFYPGSFTNISARSGGNKSSLGFYYSILTAEKHTLPVLWLDAGEMTLQQIERRAACCFSLGRIPLWAARSNGWRRNQEWTDIMRGEVFPRVRKLVGRVAFQNVSGMTPKEKTAFMRQHYFNKVGRGNFLIIVDDYLKGIESMNKNTAEYQSIGYYTSDVKSLVTEDITAGFMTFTQSNRFGVSKGKKAADIVDNDSVISLSDRIKDNCTACFIMRYKVEEELAREKNSFGNIVLKCTKIREGLGREYETFARPVKMTKGSFADNYFNLDYHGFHFSDKGLFSDVAQKLGHVAVDLSSREGTEQMP